jgi:hypothetical protein
MTSKKEREAIDEFHQGRAERSQAEIDKRSHLVDPMTDPSSGDPPAAISEHGERLGTIPVTRNAVADTEQAKQEGLDAAKQNEPTKAEKASSDRQKAAASKDRSDRMSQPAGQKPASERQQAAEKQDDHAKKDEPKSASSWTPPWESSKSKT